MQAKGLEASLFIMKLATDSPGLCYLDNTKHTNDYSDEI